MSKIYEWITDSVIRAGGTFHYCGISGGHLYGIVTVDPANIEYILKTRFPNFPKGRYFRERFSDFLGDGIFNADDQIWKDQRRAATAEMHSARFSSYSLHSITVLVQDKLLALFEKIARENACIDLQDVFLRFTFDNICTVAFGVDPGCLSIDLPDDLFAKAFEAATELTSIRFIMPPIIWKPMRKLNIGTEKRLKKAIQTVHDFAEKTVSNRRAEFQKLGGSLNDRSDLLSRLIEVDSKNPEPQFSDKLLKDFCISFILAGRDTSSVALTWFFWLLNTHPQVEHKILQELSTIIRQRPSTKDDPKTTNTTTFTLDELKKMDYLQASLSESLRLYPSVPIDFKEVMEDDLFPDGTRVKKGAKVIYSIYSMARTERIWGKDCREFKPERWINREGMFESESQFKYAVFNAGPRLCIGKKFAYNQMKMVAAFILVRYHVEVVKGQIVTPKLSTTLYMRNGLKVVVRPRE